MADTTFHGYEIKKDTMVIANIYSVHFDPKTWGDPENFRPERFLSKDEKTVIRNEALIPFSFGKRQCPGNNIVWNYKIIIFIRKLFLTKIW